MLSETREHLAARLADWRVGQFQRGLRLHVGDGLTHGGNGSRELGSAAIVRRPLSLLSVRFAAEELAPQQFDPDRRTQPVFLGNQLGRRRRDECPRASRQVQVR